MDKLNSNNTNLKVYKEPINLTDCPYLTVADGFIYLPLNRNLTSFICNTTDTVFLIFVYHTNIYSSIITVKNKDNALTKILSLSDNTLNNFVILDIQPLYISFVICPNKFINCQYKSVDQIETANNIGLTMYSACTELNASNSCITELEFLSDFHDFDSNSQIFGSIIKITSSNMEPKYETELNCRHGGYLMKENESHKFKCICPDSLAFMDSGPQCEVMQQVVEYTQYLYVLPNTNKLSMEFSLYSPALSNELELFRIELNQETLMKYIIKDGNHILTYLNQTITIEYPIDQSKKFFHPRVFIEISSGTLYFRINEKDRSVQVNTIKLLFYDRIPLIINKLNQKVPQICISNFKINKKIVDLYTPNYSTCVSSFCASCKTNQQCLYEPFKGKGNEECICKTGYVKSSEKCIKNEIMAGQLSDGMNIFISISPTKMGFARFKFRTLAPHGDLIRISTILFNISITISNKLLNTIINNENLNKKKTFLINHYSVADGEWHSVVIELTNYFLQVTLDEKLPYNSNSVQFDSDFLTNPLTDFNVYSVTFGPLSNTNPNLTTCYDTVTIFEKEELQSLKNIVLNGTLSDGCNKGLNCSTITCKNNEICIEKWQNSTCMCEENFTDFQGVCYFTKCISNPCRNNGTCIKNSEKTDYKCQCQHSYFGINCEHVLTHAQSNWWISIIVAVIIIIILIILIIILCQKKRPKNYFVADINQIQENTVMYNDRAGECDYEGPPINFELLTSGAKPEIIKEDLMARKQFYDNNNSDLIIDQPLTYTFEGFESDLNSIESSESESPPILPIKSSNFEHIKNERM